MSKYRRALPACVAPVAAGELIRRGISKHVLDGPKWRRTGRGFYVPATIGESPTQRIVEVAAMCPPEAVIGGWAAAYAHGVDQLDGLDDHTFAPRPVPVFLPPRLHRASVPGVRYLQQALRPGDVAVIGDLRFTGRIRTALDLARWAPDVTEAVVPLDAMLKCRAITKDALADQLPDIAGRRGFGQAAQAVELSRVGVRSGWESRLRMLCVLDLGFASPLVNQPIFDLDQTFLGAPDLLDPEAGLAMEYDGASWASATRPRGHRDVDQHREDNVREELFERTGLIVTRADKRDLTRHRNQLRDRLLAARADGLVRDRSRDRWTLVQPDHWYGMPA